MWISLMSLFIRLARIGNVCPPLTANMYFIFCSLRMRPISAPPSTVAISGFLLSDCRRGIFPYFLGLRQGKRNKKGEAHVEPPRFCKGGCETRPCVVRSVEWGIAPLYLFFMR